MSEMALFWQFLPHYRQHLGTSLSNPVSIVNWQHTEGPQNAISALLGKHTGRVPSQCSPRIKHTVILPLRPEMRSSQKRLQTVEQNPNRSGRARAKDRRKSVLTPCKQTQRCLILLENISEMTVHLHSIWMLGTASLNKDLQCPLTSLLCGFMAFHDVPCSNPKIMQCDRNFKVVLAEVALLDLQGPLEKMPLFGCIPKLSTSVPEVCQSDCHFKVVLAKVSFFDLQGPLEKILFFGCVPKISIGRSRGSPE